MNDNQELRALFTLPPIKTSAGTAIAAPKMPPQQVITGDDEIDAVLWLQQVVDTGNRAMIDKALESAKAIKTPMEELGMRYAEHIARTTGNNLGAALASFGFGNLEAQAKSSIEQAESRHEALSRFGDEETLFSNTPAEEACVKALHRAKKNSRNGFTYYDSSVAAKRFGNHPALVPATLDDCIYAIEYWNALTTLRYAFGTIAGDQIQEASTHDYYCAAMMAKIKPRNATEAIAAFDYLQEEERDQWNDAPAIYRNLIVTGWADQGVSP